MPKAKRTLLDRNLMSVFGNRDPALRATAIAALYAQDCVFYEADSEVRGQAALSEKVQDLLNGAPGFLFTAIDGPDVIQNMERLTWAFGPPDGQIVAKGMDIALISHGRIRSLYTFMADPEA
ncbi:nuclear transport factor 2 family protein [Sphingomonas sp. UYP23]